MSIPDTRASVGEKWAAKRHVGLNPNAKRLGNCWHRLADKICGFSGSFPIKVTELINVRAAIIARNLSHSRDRALSQRLLRNSNRCIIGAKIALLTPSYFVLGMNSDETS